MASKLACDSDSHVNHADFLHAANLRHGTDGFTSLPKEGMLWIFSPEKSDGFGRVRARDLGYQTTEGALLQVIPLRNVIQIGRRMKKIRCSLNFFYGNK
jgi:hypothetical protein